MNKIQQEKNQRLFFQDEIDEVWVRDFAYLQGKRYRKLINPVLAEITCSTVTLVDDGRFRKLPRHYVIFVPKL